MFWLVLLVIFIIAEAATVSLVSVWFAIGALAALLVSLVCDALWVQLTVFLAVSAAALWLLRPFSKKILSPRQVKTNIDALIGSQGITIENIDNIAATGRVKLGAMEWSARSEDGTPIPIGTQVVVLRIEGVKVFVTPSQQETI